MKITKKQELALALADYRECIEVTVFCNPQTYDAWTHTIWTCKWPHAAGQVIRCHGGEPNRYWFDKRITASELRGCIQLDPEAEHIILRRGNKRPQYTILDAKKYRTLVAAK